MEVDTRPTVEGAKGLHRALMSELEQVAYRSRPGSSSTPFVKAVTAPPPPKPFAGASPEASAGNGSPNLLAAFT